MESEKVGVIGGTGLGEVLAAEVGGEEILLDTPYGPPSGPAIIANWEGVDVAFIGRHGRGHRLNPSTVPYRANIWALKKLGVSAIIASGACGSLREDVAPGQLVLCDQVIDRTYRRDGTFFDHDIVAHIEFADPFCERLRTLLIEGSQRVQTTVHPRGTYVCMEGPQFSTRAESQMHQAWGGDLIGMTCMPEAKLAREAEICYALIALPTDYDCWRPAKTNQREEALLQEILGNLRHATDSTIALIRETLRLINAGAADDSTLAKCRCHDALKLAIWSDKSRVDPATVKRLEWLVGRHFPGGGTKAL